MDDDRKDIGPWIAIGILCIILSCGYEYVLSLSGIMEYNQDPVTIIAD
jgi:hypothetical protein